MLLPVGRQTEIFVEIRSFNPISSDVNNRRGEQHVPETSIYCCLLLGLGGFPDGCLFSRGRRTHEEI